MQPTVLSPDTGTRTKTDFIPKNFSEMYSHYYYYALKIVVRNGIDPQDAPDVTNAILETFLVRNGDKENLGYDTSYAESTGTRKASFGTYLSRFLYIYVMHHRERQQKKNFRDGFSLDSGDFAETAGRAMLAEDEHTELMQEDLLSSIRKHLATLPVNGACDLSLLFEMILLQREQDYKDNKELAEAFGVTLKTIYNWTHKLREEVGKVLSQ